MSMILGVSDLDPKRDFYPAMAEPGRRWGDWEPEEVDTDDSKLTNVQLYCKHMKEIQANKSQWDQCMKECWDLGTEPINHMPTCAKDVEAVVAGIPLRSRHKTFQGLAAGAVFTAVCDPEWLQAQKPVLSLAPSAFGSLEPGTPYLHRNESEYYKMFSHCNYTQSGIGYATSNDYPLEQQYDPRKLVMEKGKEYERKPIKEHPENGESD
jgi:hypothetical protein